MNMPDFIAHVIPPNGRRPWVDKLLSEGIRLAIVVVIALTSAYFAIQHQRNVDLDMIEARFVLNERRAETLELTAQIICQNTERMRDNQRTVLLTMLTISETLDDRGSVLLRPIPNSVRRDILAALSNLPDALAC
jgi:hypothetical protein